MDLAAAFEWIDSLRGGGNLVAIEVGGALFEFGKVFDGLEGPLGAEEALNIYTAEAGSIDAAAVVLRTNVAYEVSGGGSVAIDVAIETGDAFHAVGALGFAIGGGVELLLWKLRDEQAQAFEIFGVEYAVKDFLEIGDGDEFALRDVAEVGSGGKENGGWKFGEEMIGNVEIEIEALEAREGFDFFLREDHSADGMIRMWKWQEALRENALVANFLRGHVAEFRPGGVFGKFGGGAHLDGFAARHFGVRMRFGFKNVALGEQLLLALHDGSFALLVAGHHLLERFFAQERRRDLVVAGFGFLRARVRRGREKKRGDRSGPQGGGDEVLERGEVW